MSKTLGLVILIRVDSFDRIMIIGGVDKGRKNENPGKLNSYFVHGYFENVSLGKSRSQVIA
jgi:hypothetical protein